MYIYIKRFNLATFLCLSQARTWISSIICHGLFFMFNELRSEVIVYFVEIGDIVNCPSIFKRSFHKTKCWQLIFKITRKMKNNFTGQNYFQVSSMDRYYYVILTCVSCSEVRNDLCKLYTADINYYNHCIKTSCYKNEIKIKITNKIFFNLLPSFFK